MVNIWERGFCFVLWYRSLEISFLMVFLWSCCSQTDCWILHRENISQNFIGFCRLWRISTNALTDVANNTEKNIKAKIFTVYVLVLVYRVIWKPVTNSINISNVQLNLCNSAPPTKGCFFLPQLPLVSTRLRKNILAHERFMLKVQREYFCAWKVYADGSERIFWHMKGFCWWFRENILAHARFLLMVQKEYFGGIFYGQCSFVKRGNFVAN